MRSFSSPLNVSVELNMKCLLLGNLQLMRTCAYAATILAGYSRRQKSAAKWLAIGSQISAARVVSRLFDDIPCLYGNLSYGWGMKVFFASGYSNYS